jgi:hypothetical protein
MDDERKPLGPDDRAMMRVIHKRRPVSQTMWLRSPNSEWRHVHVTTFPLIGERDTLYGAMTIFWEV